MSETADAPSSPAAAPAAPAAPAVDLSTPTPATIDAVGDKLQDAPIPPTPEIDLSAQDPKTNGSAWLQDISEDLRTNPSKLLYDSGTS